MENKKPSIVYNKRIYEPKAIFKVQEPKIQTPQVALVVREQNKDFNEVMIVDMLQFYEAFNRRLGQHIEVKNATLISVEDWVKSFGMKEKKES